MHIAPTPSVEGRRALCAQLQASCHHSIEHQGQKWHKHEEAGKQHPEYEGGDYGEGGDDDAGGLLFAFDVVLHGVSDLITPAKIECRFANF